MADIREALEEDFDLIWEIFHQVVSAGETYPIHRNASKKEAHQIWIEQSLHHFETEQIIFLDPDNGFSTQNQGKKSLKYILAEDCKTYLSHNKIIIFTQFQSFREKTSSHLDNLLSNLLDSGLNTNTPIIRNRTGPNTFYITIKPTKLKINLGSIFKKYAEMFQHVELIDKV